MSKTFLYIFITFGLVLGMHARALSPSAISVRVVPQNPAPNENIDISISTFSANLDIVTISWSVNGKLVSSGVGQKTFSATVGPAGVETRVEARILLPEGEVRKIMVFRPATMSLLWQANDSYVPPFYKGKALPALESEVKVVALPEIRTSRGTISPKNLHYEWKVNYQNRPNDSSYGKNFFLFSGDYLDSANAIEVLASTPDRQYTAGGNITLETYAPQISFYRIDDDLGVDWGRAATSPHRLSGEEILVAEPYFVSPKDIRRPELTFRWFINNLMTNVESFQKNIIPLRVEGGVSGTSRVRVEVENTDQLFGGASREINIQF